MRTTLEATESSERGAARSRQMRTDANDSTSSARHTGWWESLFDDVWVEAHMRSKDERTTEAEVSFLTDVLGLQSGHRVLDVPCGIGRHSLQLAKMGMRVTGVDRTDAFIRAATRRSRELGVAVDWIEQDMRQIDWDAEFDGAFCFWGSFGYFDEQDNAEFLAKLAKSVKPNGRVLVDTHVYETLLPKLCRRMDWRRLDRMLVLEERSFDVESSRTNTHWTIIRDDQKSEKFTSIRLYTFRELASLFQEAGLDDLQAYGSIQKDPFTLESPRLYLVGTRH
jgi:2-polyprenyl-3-methyl-5-hydroxy-6-metoxy-1,4-benzoquinol methylase